jgi:acetoin utilization deacetylase AcuC-like enzyme
MSQIRVFYDDKWYLILPGLDKTNPASLLHSPKYEILSGHVTQWFGLSRTRDQEADFLESPSRVKSIKDHLERFPESFPFHAAGNRDFGMEPILAVHDPGYVNYLQTIFDEWYLPPLRGIRCG